MIARMTMNVKMAGGGNFGNCDPALQRSPEAIIRDRVDHCKDLQFVKGEQLFGVLYTTIHKAAMDGSCAGISFFIKPGPGRGTVKRAHVDDYDKSSVCPIHYAAERGHDHVVSMLVENGCEVDIETGDKMTALMYAAKEGKCSTIQLLWDLRANLLKKNRAGMTAAHFAAQGNHHEAMDLLVKLSSMDRLRDIEVAKANDLKRLADSTSAGNDDQSVASSVQTTERSRQKKKKPSEDPALNAMLGFHVPTLDDFDDDDFDDEESGKSKKKRKQKERVKTLEEVLAVPATVVVDSPSNNGMRPLHMAALSNSLDCVRFLISVQVEIEAKDKVGETALHKAAQKSYFAIYNMMVKDGNADENSVNVARQTPAQILKDDSSF